MCQSSKELSLNCSLSILFTNLISCRILIEIASKKKNFKILILTHISLAYFRGKLANRADPDQTPQNAASDQGLHCLLTACSITI